MRLSILLAILALTVPHFAGCDAGPSANTQMRAHLATKTESPGAQTVISPQTVPPVTEAQAAASLPANAQASPQHTAKEDPIAKVAAQFQLVSILKAGNDARALINDTLVRVGDNLQAQCEGQTYACQVTRIEEDRAFLRWKGNDVELKLRGAEESPLAQAPISLQKTPSITEAQAEENRVRPFREARAALEEYQQGTGSSEAVLVKINKLEAYVSLYQEAGFDDYARIARDQHTSVAFAFADETLKRGDLDMADRVYRRLIEFYVGSAYAGIRDRARIGIDDVREAHRHGK